MSEIREIRVPNIGDFESVEVIEIHVAPGDLIEPETPLITLETDKAAMDIPSPLAGRVTVVQVGTGDKVSENDVIVLAEVTDAAAMDAADETAASEPEQATPTVKLAAPGAQVFDGNVDEQAEVLVLGGGVGGYTAAFRAADLGRQVTLVERRETLGGVCLNVGCIPSKALLHAAKVIDDAEAMAEHGIRFSEPEIDTRRLRGWKDSIIHRLTSGLSTMAQQRKVKVIRGVARFRSDHVLEVETGTGVAAIGFEQCIIAAGSEPTRLPNLPDDPRIMDSTGALELDELPERLLVIGGGIIGLEMATVYDALGVKVSVVELTSTLIPEADRDLVRPLERRIKGRYEQILLNTRVTGLTATDAGIEVTFAGDKAPDSDVFGRVLVAVGRRPNGLQLNAEAAGVEVNSAGFIPSDNRLRTNVAHIFSIGDIRGNPMLAHKAGHEGKVAAEVACGHRSVFDARAIPSVAYTDPEVAWVGLTENDARANGVEVGKGSFPWAASGRALALNRDQGLTKLLFDKQTNRVVGMGAVGPHAGDLVAEAALAIEMGCEAEDIGLTIHAHPTLSETVAMAAEVFSGTITDLYLPKR